MRSRGLKLRGDLVLLVGSVCLLSYLACPSPARPEVAVSADVLCGGGTRSQSTSLMLHDTVGQGPIGPRATGGDRVLCDGFWATLPESIAPCVQWMVPLTVTNGAVYQYRTFGEHCLGTEEYDPGLDEIIPPPGFEFYAFFQGIPPYMYLSTDIKSSDPDSVGWLLTVMNVLDFTVSWSPDSLPDGYVLDIDGVDMSTTDHIDRLYAQTLLIWAKRRELSSVDQDVAALPRTLSLWQNAPNPFGRQTVIHYAVPTASHVRMFVVGVNGQLIRTLVDHWSEPGYYSLRWDGRDGMGREVSNGLYFYRLEGSGTQHVRKMVVLK